MRETYKNIDNVLVDNRPRVAEFTPDGTQVWVSAEIGGSVTVIEAATRKVLGKVNFEIQGITKDAIQPVGVRITKDNKKAFVALGPANRVAVVDVATRKVEKYLLVGTAGLEPRLHARRKTDVHHQRNIERRVGDRRCHP